jgi:hypothetical protein
MARDSGLTKADADRALAAWKRAAPPAARNLLDADAAP